MTERTRNDWNLSFHQARHGEKQHGQTPAGLFLEFYNGISRSPSGLDIWDERPENLIPPTVGVVARGPAGQLRLHRVARTKDEALGWVVRCVDGHLTAFEHDDYSARLIVLDPDTTGLRLAWLEILNPGSDADAHPEID